MPKSWRKFFARLVCCDFSCCAPFCKKVEPRPDDPEYADVVLTLAKADRVLEKMKLMPMLRDGTKAAVEDGHGDGSVPSGGGDVGGTAASAEIASRAGKSLQGGEVETALQAKVHEYSHAALVEVQSVG